LILLDTHIWVRWLVPVHPLPAAVVGRIEDADRVAVSAISCWEVGMLVYSL
jgi:PIN domain nuclease of toxin-antitoxin system